MIKKLLFLIFLIFTMTTKTIHYHFHGVQKNQLSHNLSDFQNCIIQCNKTNSREECTTKICLK